MRTENNYNYKYIRWAIIAIVVLVLGIFILSAIGKALISEVVQDVIIEEGEKKTYGIVIGERAPPWELANLRGRIIQSSDLLDKPLVLTFWVSWNPVSTDQIKIFAEYLSGNNDGFFRIVAINNQESRGVVSNFIRRGGYQMPVLLDQTGEVGELYKVRTLPITYFLDRDGVIRDAYLGILSEKELLEKVEAIAR